MQFPPSLLVFGALATFFGTAQAAPVRKVLPKGKTNYQSATYRFAVWLPLQPSISHDDGPPLNAIIFQSDTPLVTYGVNVFTPLAGQSFRVSQAPLFLDSFQDKIARAMNGRIVAQQDIQLGAAKGRAIRIVSVQGRLTTFARTYFLSGAMYQLTASVRTALIKNQTPPMARFFNSFRILPQ